ncbi:MAG: transglutaminase-like domain-containing protein, partial [Nitrospirota bacterium]
MNSRYTRTLRIVSAIVLCFFTWTFGGVFDIAYAVKASQQAAGNSQQVKSQESKEQKPEEKLEKALNDLEQFLSDTSTDTDTKKGKAKGKKGEIEALDVEMKKQFSATEKKLKDEGLPYEILERHYDFVKKYDNNLNELRNNLDAIEKGKDKKETDTAIEKTKKFLEKVKPPKKHVPLDPNKLPHRTMEPVFTDPREKPEEFTEGKEMKAVSKEQKPVLVASNGSLSGLLSPDTLSSMSLRAEGEAISQNILLAAATPPNTSDLAETIEVKFTPAIQAKAAELGHNPTKIYNWVRNNIEYVPTYGSIQGADYCLQTKQCNDFDTASLLIALLRASGIHSRYVYGTVEIPIEKVNNWIGGFTDSMEALRLLASARIPTKGMTVGGKIEYVRVEHVWVEAWIDYIPSRGARHRTGQGDTWIPLDASFKQYNYTQGIDIKTAVPFDAQSFIDQIQSTATINETEGYVTNVNSLFIQQTMTDYQTQVQNYITQNYPNATVGDVLGKKEIQKQEFSYLLGTLPYKTIVKGSTYASIPDTLRHKLNFNVIKDMYDEIMGTPINITKSLPELAGKKITLNYSPATAQDEAVINSYLPKPHADGTPIQPNELPSSLPSYLINLKPE